MDITEVTIIHHVAIVLVLLWILASFSWCHPVIYFICLIYLYQVHEGYTERLRRRLRFEEQKQANQRRVLSDSETVRWLNHAIEKIWPICMEQIASQKLLLALIPWFLEKYKPWTAKEAVVQHLYLGRTPPMFTDMRVLSQCPDDDHLVLELGMRFLSGNDMSGILAVKLRKRLGFGLKAKLHVTGMHVEGKVLVGVKFLREWPFLGRLRVCFAEPPYFQMTVKPIFNHGLDVTELPGIAGWLDKLLAVAFEQTLVQPNMLVVDVEKLASAPTEKWFSVDEKDAIAYARVEIVEAADMKPSDPNGLADPYVKGQLGPYRFRTKTQKKTLTPIWQEEFKIYIYTWESLCSLNLEVCDKDHFHDDTLGDCSVNISDLKDGQRHDMWLPLKNIKMGRLHLAITVVDINGKGEDSMCTEEPVNKEENKTFVATETTQKDSDSNASSEKFSKFLDKLEPINIEGKQQPGVWIYHPGSDVSQTWEPRKGSSRHFDTQIQREANYSIGSTNSAAAESPKDDGSSSDANPGRDRTKPLKTVRMGLRKLGSVFHKNHRKEELINTGEVVHSPHFNLRAVNEKGTVVNFIGDDNVPIPVAVKNTTADKECSSPDGSVPESPRKGHMKGMAKSILKHAGNSAHGLKDALSGKTSRKSKRDTEAASIKSNSQGSKGELGSLMTERDTDQVSNSSDESTTSTRDYSNTPRLDGIPFDSAFVLEDGRESLDLKDQNGEADHGDLPINSNAVTEVALNDVERTNVDGTKCSDMQGGRVDKSLDLKPSDKTKNEAEKL